MICTRRVHYTALLTVLGTFVLSGRVANAVEVQWNFDSIALTPSYSDHTTSIEYRNGATTSSVVEFGTAASFGITALPGGSDTVMKFPTFSGAQGLGLYDLGPANGGGAYVNEYTMAWDVYFPTINGYESLLQTSATNANDGDLFIASDGTLGIGAGGYHGSVSQGEWHRIVATLNGTQMQKYIDGAFVGTTALNGVDGRWSMYTDSDTNANPAADSFILSDENGDTLPGYISTFYYRNSVVDAATIQAWGGADADGIVVPEPAGLAIACLGLVGLLVWRPRKA
jgi:hypothetical protein